MTKKQFKDIFGNKNFTITDWLHFGWTYNAEKETLELYVNGQLVKPWANKKK